MASERAKRVKTFGILGGAVACVGVAFAVHATGDRGAPRADASGETAVASEAKAAKRSADQVLAKVASAECTAGSASAPTRRREGNPKARAAAQRGLSFLAANTKAWQARENCYGCHVQAVTLEGLVVGRQNQYDVSDDDLAAILDGLLRLPGGARTVGGLQYRGGSLLQPSKAFGGAAIARYDAAIDHKLSDDLFQIAEQLLAYQREDGGYDMSYNNGPVAVGDVHGTYLAMRTWKQAYERSADDRWLTAVQKAEKYMSRKASELVTTGSADVQQLAYALIGLLEGGVGASEEVPSALRRKLLEVQGEDGGWALWANRESSGLATGEVLYVLRLSGMTDDDPAVRRGTDWLIEKQQPDGGWSNSGSSRAEAMWAVLGLVSLDVLTVAIEGVQDGQLAADDQRIAASASDNKGGAVAKMEVTIDDILVASQCGAEIAYAWDTRSIEDGKHIVVIAATNTGGEVSKRRLELYTGDIYLTQPGSRYSDEGTVVSVRNIAPDSKRNTVRMRIFERVGDGADAKLGKQLTVVEQTGSQGAMRFVWDGKDAAGEAAASGKYIARLEVVDGAGAVVQSEELAVVNESQEAQRAKYGEIEGRLQFAGGDGAENSVVELVDEAGRIVDSAVSTKTGQYRFRNVDKGNYKVRLKKRGYAAVEQDVSAQPAAAPAKADMVMTAE